MNSDVCIGTNADVVDVSCETVGYVGGDESPGDENRGRGVSRETLGHRVVARNDFVKGAE